MPTSVPGNSVNVGAGIGAPIGEPASRRRNGGDRRQRAGALRGFTLIELLIVIAIVAISVGVVSLALRHGSASKLAEEGARLAALLEMARAEARASGAAVSWVPGAGDNVQSDVALPPQFRFIGLPAAQPLPTRWLDPGTRAVVVGAAAVVLGPDAILPAQRIVLQLADQQVELVSDGLAPFAIGDTGVTTLAPAR